ncbi:MAG: DUF2726 domain-containing protein [Chloroflexi bacterium]|jgi:hypothetical protein|nr:DUF2726 domain-containing protein [Chloroflexota bacterium]
MSKSRKKGCLSALFGLGSTAKDDLNETITPAADKDRDPMPYRLRDDFLSAAEHSFYLVLKSMMGSYFTICPKVSLADIFYVTNPDRNLNAYNRINRKHVDFLICDAGTMKPRFGIELDDKSHNRQDRISRDDFVEDLFETAGLPLVRIPVRPTYNTNELGVLFKTALLKTQTSAPARPASNSSTQVGSPTGIPQTKSIQNPIPEPDEVSPVKAERPANGQPPFCPKCGQPMVLRTAEVGANKGKQFWGCVNYPKCKTVIAIN